MHAIPIVITTLRLQPRHTRRAEHRQHRRLRARARRSTALLRSASRLDAMLARHTTEEIAPLREILEPAQASRRFLTSHH